VTATSTGRFKLARVELYATESLGKVDVSCLTLPVSSCVQARA
jgi:hypothetical protein